MEDTAKLSALKLWVLTLLLVPWGEVCGQTGKWVDPGRIRFHNNHFLIFDFTKQQVQTFEGRTYRLDQKGNSLLIHSEPIVELAFERSVVSDDSLTYYFKDEDFAFVWTLLPYETLVSRSPWDESALSGKLFNIFQSNWHFKHFFEFVEDQRIIIRTTITDDGDTSSNIVPYKFYEVDSIRILHVNNFYDFRFILTKANDSTYSVFSYSVFFRRHQVWTLLDPARNIHASKLLGTWYPLPTDQISPHELTSFDEVRFCPEKLEFRSAGELLDSWSWAASRFGKIVAMWNSERIDSQEINFRGDLLPFASPSAKNNLFRKEVEYFEGSCR